MTILVVPDIHGVMGPRAQNRGAQRARRLTTDPVTSILLMIRIANY